MALIVSWRALTATVNGRMGEVATNAGPTLSLSVLGPLTVEIDGVAFQVREIRAVGDGSELRAKLSRI